MHAIDTDTGIEQWAFMPQSLLKNLLTFYENPTTTEHVYGIDGAITIWQDDVNKDGSITKKEICSNIDEFYKKGMEFIG